MLAQVRFRLDVKRLYLGTPLGLVREAVPQFEAELDVTRLPAHFDAIIAQHRTADPLPANNVSPYKSPHATRNVVVAGKAATKSRNSRQAMREIAHGQLIPTLLVWHQPIRHLEFFLSNNANEAWDNAGVIFQGRTRTCICRQRCRRWRSRRRSTAFRCHRSSGPGSTAPGRRAVRWARSSGRLA